MAKKGIYFICSNNPGVDLKTSAGDSDGAALMSTVYQNEERRLALRMALRLPLVVSGRIKDGAAWSEPTETDDISTGGASFHLNQEVSIGDTLYIRAHHADGSPTETTATVVRESPAIYGTARIGVQVIDKIENWTRFFVSWVADQQTVMPSQSHPSN